MDLAATGIMDLLAKDLAKEILKQRSMREFPGRLRRERATDSRALTAKGSAMADLDADLQAHKGAHSGGSKEWMATMKYIPSLHPECDWLLKWRPTCRSIKRRML